MPVSLALVVVNFAAALVAAFIGLTSNVTKTSDRVVILLAAAGFLLNWSVAYLKLLKEWRELGSS